MKKIRTIEAAVIEEKKLRVCAYVRVSTDQAEQRNSHCGKTYKRHIDNFGNVVESVCWVSWMVSLT